MRLLCVGISLTPALADAPDAFRLALLQTLHGSALRVEQILHHSLESKLYLERLHAKSKFPASARSEGEEQKFSEAVQLRRGQQSPSEETQ